MGGTVDAQLRMALEVGKRVAMSAAVDAAHKPILASKVLPAKQRIAVSDSLSYSRLKFGAAIWSPLNAQTMHRWSSRYIARIRLATGLRSSSDKHISGLSVLVRASKVPPAAALAFERLRYLWRAFHHGSEALRTLVAHSLARDHSWGALLVSDLRWLSERMPHRAGELFRTGELSIPELDRLLTCASKSSWKNLVNGASRQEVAQLRRDNTMELFHKQFTASMAELGIHFDASPRRQQPLAVHHCKFCDFQSFSMQGIQAHLADVHGISHDAHRLTSKDETTCPACLTLFHCRYRMLVHLKRSLGCLNMLRRDRDPVDHAQPVDKIPARDWSPAFRKHGPLRPSAADTGFCPYLLSDGSPIHPPLDDALLCHSVSDGLCIAIGPDAVRAPQAVPLDPATRPAHWSELTLHQQLRLSPPVLHTWVVAIHLFSGRRRSGDWHDIMHQRCTSTRRLIVISYDLVNGNDLLDPGLVSFLRDAIRQGLVAIVMGGPPCETWSVARYSDSPGPPPLRSAAAPWGLDCLSLKHHAQVWVGSRLMHVQLLLMADVLATVTACGILEHPARIGLHDSQCKGPHRPPSIWSTGEMKAILQHRDATLYTLDQERFGACSRKPTTFLLIRIPDAHCTALQLSSVPPPRTGAEVLIGRDDNGAFKTSRAKEYPHGLALLLADWGISHIDRLEVAQRGFHMRMPDGFINALRSHQVQWDPYVDDAAAMGQDYVVRPECSQVFVA